MASSTPSWLGLSRTKVSGGVAAANIAASIGLVALGVLIYIRKVEPIHSALDVYGPTAQFGGIFLYGNVIWAITWIGSFVALRHKQDMGSLKTWLIIFLISLAVGTFFAVGSLK